MIAAGGDPCCVYGHHVIVEHDEGWSSLYAHLSAVAVSAGDLVEQGVRFSGSREIAGRRTASISTSSYCGPGCQSTHLAILSRHGTTCQPLTT